MVLLRGIMVICVSAMAKNLYHIEIAPDVFMPIVNHGLGNETKWLEIGGRGIDASYDYTIFHSGSNRKVADAVRSGIVDRSDIFITTKIPCCPSKWYTLAKYVCSGWEPSIILNSPAQEIAGGLAKEGLDFSDLLIMHWPCDNFEDTVAVYKDMEVALAKGLTRAIGVSNFNASLLDALMKRTTITPTVTQNAVSIGNHFNSYYGNDDRTMEFCRQHGITIQAYGPLGGTTYFSSHLFKDEVLKGISRLHNKSVAQIALRWLVQRGIAPVTGGDNVQHMIEDLDIFDFNLTEEQMARLNLVRYPFRPMSEGLIEVFM